jgi:hypothetical protein
MKKVALICLVLMAVLGLGIFLLWTNLPSIASYALTRTLGAKVTVSGIESGYQDGLLTVQLQGVAVTGIAQGRIERLRIVLKVTGALHFKEIAMSDFELTVKPASDATTLLPFALERLELSRGVVTYAKERFVIRELSVQNFNIDKPLVVRADITNGVWFDTLRLSAEGLYRGRDSDIKGHFEVTGADLHRLQKQMGGKARVNGQFAFAKNRLTFKGAFDAFNYELRDSVLKTPIMIERQGGNLVFAYTYADKTIDVNVTGATFKGVPFVLDLKTVGDDLARFELTSDFFNVQDVKALLNLDALLKASIDIVAAIKNGKIKARRFLYQHKKPLAAELELKKATFDYEGKSFDNVEGTLDIDETKMDLSAMKGTFRNSTFHGITGVLPFAKDKDIKLQGNYTVDLGDIPFLFDTGELKLKRGTTEGSIEVEGRKETGYRFRGKGKLSRADVTWRKVSGLANGSYRFTDEDITFDPLIIDKGNSNMVIKGRWNKKYLGLNIKGTLDVDEIRLFMAIPFLASGAVSLEATVEMADEMISVGSTVNLDRIAAEIPQLMKKEQGIKSGADFAFSMKGKDVRIDRFFFNLDAIDLSLKGNIADRKKIDLDVALNIKGVEKVAPLFFFEGNTPRGDVELNMAVRDLLFPLRKLPRLSGFLKVQDGFLRIPGLPKPVEAISLACDFRGEAFDADIRRFVWDRSEFSNGKLHVAGLEAPKFSLSLDVDAFDLNDFQTDSRFVIPTISGDSIAARLSGDFALKAGRVTISGITGDNVEIKGTVGERRLSLAQLKADVFGGTAEGSGAIDLSTSLPSVEAAIKLGRIKSGLFLDALGSKSQVIEATTSLVGDLTSEGETIEQLIKGIDGRAVIYSRNGVIKKWNLLSKVFGLLNVIDLVRGRVDLKAEGLSYRRMGGTFSIKDGVFRTGDFLIDSPSMLITGDGTIDVVKKTVQGDLVVSPLVTVDSVIDKIPILRNILKKKKQGFLYAAYKVSGPLDDPDVSVSFVNSIGGKAVEILRNILTLPLEIFESQ